jgi:hypothetical protein
VTDSELLDLCRLNLKESTLIAPNKLDAIRTQFKREANVIFVEAKRSTVATAVKIPGWFIVLTIFLGWNEFMTVLRNPLYFSLMAIAISGNPQSYLFFSCICHLVLRNGSSRCFCFKGSCVGSF